MQALRFNRHKAISANLSRQQDCVLDALPPRTQNCGPGSSGTLANRQPATTLAAECTLMKIFQTTWNSRCVASPRQISSCLSDRKLRFPISLCNFRKTALRFQDDGASAVNSSDRLAAYFIIASCSLSFSLKRAIAARGTEAAVGISAVMGFTGRPLMCSSK